jgi:hypothetical protein
VVSSSGIGAAGDRVLELGQIAGVEVDAPTLGDHQLTGQRRSGGPGGGQGVDLGRGRAAALVEEALLEVVALLRQAAQAPSAR